MCKNIKIKKKLLWISASVPCKKIPHAGGQTFRYYFEQIILDGRFDVKLIALNDNMDKEIIEHDLSGIDYKIVYNRRDLKEKIKKVCNLSYKYNPWSKYGGLLPNYGAFKILKYIKEYKEKGFIPDCIILEWTAIVMLASDIRKIYPNVHLIASEHDVSFIGWKRREEYYKGIKSIFWKMKYKNEKNRELNALKLCNLIFIHNPDNKQILIENGITQEKIQWLVPYFNDMSLLNRNSNCRDILFFGAMNRPENYLSAKWFINHVMPRLKDLDIRFVILGGNPPQDLKKLESSHIHVTGFVNTVEPYFESSMCLVAPLVLGAGIKVKILEALSSGIPVLTNSIGIEGISAINGSEYIHCEEPEDYEFSIRSIYNGNIDISLTKQRARNFIKRYSIVTSKENYIKTLINLEEIYGNN